MSNELFSTAGVTFRRAELNDVVGIVALLADDALGAAREGTDLATYRLAFEAIDAAADQLLIVGLREGELLATFQLSFIPGMSRGGALRAQIEAVRVADSLRGSGVGSLMIEWALAESRRRGCALVQLTTDKSRTAAHRFYERLGFVASHEGMKLVF